MCTFVVLNEKTLKMKKKETKITQKITYISNDIDVKDWEDAYEEYKEECEDEDEEPEDIYEFARKETDLNMEEDIFTLKRLAETRSEKWVVTGTLGLWDGRHIIFPKVFPSLQRALSACWKDCEIVEVVTDEKGDYLIFTGHHHDGTNCFELRPVDAESADHIEDEFGNGEPDETVLAYLNEHTLPLTYEMIGR